jgi:hypothetical protein
MTTTATTTIATSQTTAASADEAATDAGLGPVTYRPGATPATVGLVLYAVISVHGRLTIVGATPDDAPAHTPHRRTSTGQVRRCRLAEGITAWVTAEVQVDNPVSAQVADQLADPPLYPGYHRFAGPVVFTGTGTGADSTRPIGLTATQVLLLRALHACAADAIAD